MDFVAPALLVVEYIGGTGLLEYTGGAGTGDDPIVLSSEEEEEEVVSSDVESEEEPARELPATVPLVELRPIKIRWDKLRSRARRPSGCSLIIFGNLSLFAFERDVRCLN